MEPSGFNIQSLSKSFLSKVNELSAPGSPPEGYSFGHCYVVDTNVIMGAPDTIGTLAHLDSTLSPGEKPNLVVVTNLTRAELDRLKSDGRPEMAEKAYEARETIRGLHGYLTGGLAPVDFLVDTSCGYNHGVRFRNGSCLMLMPHAGEGFPSTGTSTDERIISCAIMLRESLRSTNQWQKVSVISDDTNFLDSCNQWGINSEIFGRVDPKDDYSGFVEVHLDGPDYDSYQNLYGRVVAAQCQKEADRSIPLEMIAEHLSRVSPKATIYPNQFIRFFGHNLNPNKPFRVSQKKDKASCYFSNFARFVMGRKAVTEGDRLPKLPYSYNWQQECALELMFDPDIDYVSLIGEAGTGKTILSLDAALTMLFMDPREYHISKVLVANPVLDQSQHGYLPGTKVEKLKEETQNFSDALRFLFGFHRNTDITKEQVIKKIESMVQKGDLELESLVYVPGRTLHDYAVVLDETQDQEPQAMKTFLTRLGNNSKVFIAGDPSQIKNHHCRFHRNGLLHVVKRLRGCPNFGYLTLDIVERSRAAKVVVERFRAGHQE